jgi:hypothetical protein
MLSHGMNATSPKDLFANKLMNYGQALPAGTYFFLGRGDAAALNLPIMLIGHDGVNYFVSGTAQGS